LWYNMAIKNKKGINKMERRLAEIISMVKELPEKYLEETLEKVKEIKEKADSDEESDLKSCPRCNSKNVVRNGRKRKKQAYLCRACGKSFVETTKSAIAHSQSSATVWKQVISDTVEGLAIDRTASDLDLSHSTVFRMRHKILCCIEQAMLEKPIELTGVCETDETYILESVKGRKIPDGYHRKARKHGAVATKRGISDEYICLCTSVTETNSSMAVAVNRATPSKEEIRTVFEDKVNEDTLILCDGIKSYDVLEAKCKVATSRKINKVNGFHSFIKDRNRSARGFATIYLNRYNALFSKIFADKTSSVEEIYKLVTASNDSFKSISDINSLDLLII